VTYQQTALTLLIFARGNDGFVIISDRKESEKIGQGNEVPKYYLPENREFFLALAGDGTVPKALFAALERSKDVDSANIISTIQDFVTATFAVFQTQVRVQGFLVTKDSGNFKLHTIFILGDGFVPSENDSGFFTSGDPEAKLIIKHLVRNINFSSLPCEVVAKHLLAAISDVAETVSSVGVREKFGFDVTVFMNSGKILQRKRYTDSGARLKISFELSDDEIFSHSENNGDEKNE